MKIISISDGIGEKFDDDPKPGSAKASHIIVIVLIIIIGALFVRYFRGPVKADTVNPNVAQDILGIS